MQIIAEDINDVEVLIHSCVLKCIYLVSNSQMTSSIHG